MAGERDSDGELGRTATAPGSTPGVATEAAPVGNQLGRYRLQRELGRGGMGVVHAAFDPDLERRVALKVLRSVDVVEARQRLLREARAMARVAHPNVLAVHEVGTADGRDYIAMDLVDGGTLEDWLAQPRSVDEIVAAFVAAGRGLAAAHAAALVHRDFKPRNVLIHKDGRIVVTDFGLVVGMENPDALGTTLPSGSFASTDDTPSSLSGLTVTGSLLGTPAYMAPEQWTGGAVGPQTDQFAFCVALWEALARARPYRGGSLDELKTDVCEGKRTDDSKLPRRMRKLLARGLDPDPAKRWPSMNALMSALTRAQRRTGAAIAIGGGALVVGALAVAAFGRGHAAGPGCAPPILAPTKVWSAGDADALRKGRQDLAVASLDRDMNAWQQARGRVCKTAPGTREPQLSCLDGVLARIQVVKQAALAVKNAKQVEVDGMLIDPAVCEVAGPPRLSHGGSDALRQAFTTQLERSQARADLTEGEANEIVAAAASDPCANAYAFELASYSRTGTERARDLDEADRAAQRCADDRVIADVALAATNFAVTYAEADTATKIKRLEALVEHVSQPDLEADLEIMRAWLAVEGDHLDEAITRHQHASELYAKRGMVRTSIVTSMARFSIYRMRATPEDLAAIPASLDQIRRIAVEKLGEKDQLVRRIDWQRASWLWDSGDVAAADELRQRLVNPTPPSKPRIVRGHVVDEKGEPVAGAEVMVGPGPMKGDSLHAAIPDDALRSTRSAADGQFEIPSVDSDSVAIAQLGELRSFPVTVTDDVTLTLKPTSRVAGRVDLHGLPSQVAVVYVDDIATELKVKYSLSAPVQRDGTFVVDGVPRSKVQIKTVRVAAMSQSFTSKELMIDKPVVDGVALELKFSTRSLKILVRSAYGVALANAQVLVIPGKQASTNMHELITKTPNFQAKIALPIRPDQANPAVHDRSKPGDLFALATNVATDEVSACAMPLPEHIDDALLKKQFAKPENLAKVPVTCVPVGPKDEIVVVEVQPWPRLD